jgi:hypothetical protein
LRLCPLCQHEYGREAVRILAVESDNQLVHITCSQCRTAMLAIVMVSAVGLSSVGMITDLNAHDAEQAQQRTAFHSDEVLDFQELMESPQAFERLLLMRKN